MMTDMGVAKKRLLPGGFLPGGIKVMPFHLGQGLCMPEYALRNPWFGWKP